MKKIIFVMLMMSQASYAGKPVEVIDGVPFECAGMIRYQLIREHAIENKGDREEIESFIQYIRETPAFSCRDRRNPNIEDLAWCDGTGCSGMSAELKNGKCVTSKGWSGQDDQDYVDPVEHAKDCLVAKDFKRK